MRPDPRPYQLNIYQKILNEGNTLVVLPTGLGKTLIAFMLIAEKNKKPGTCLFLAPTKPLVKQHMQTFLDFYPEYTNDAVVVSGETPKTKRAPLYSKKIIFSTPQTIKNDLKNKLIESPNQIKICVFDEAHRAIGEYAYTYIAEQVHDSALIVGLTASPGGDRLRILKILENLSIQNTQIKTKSDPDVLPYIKQISVNWLEVTLPPDLLRAKSLIDKMTKEGAAKLASMGILVPLKSKKRFMALRQRITSMQSNAKYGILVHYSILLNLLHMSELLETQGTTTLKNYITKIKSKTTKSAGILINKPEMVQLTNLLDGSSQEHPKLDVLVELLKSNTGKSIVFAQYRDQVSLIQKLLEENGISSRIFLGRKDKYTRKQQEEAIADFRSDKFRVLVASSIGEEGLDIPAVDSVIFYEPIPSEIRSIQRRGRAGRFKEGHVYILITKGTRDEYFYWASVNREKRMKSILYNLQNQPKASREETKNQRTKKVKNQPVSTASHEPTATKPNQTKLDRFF